MMANILACSDTAPLSSVKICVVVVSFVCENARLTTNNAGLQMYALLSTSTVNRLHHLHYVKLEAELLMLLVGC
jgi:hypothetical protein